MYLYKIPTSDTSTTTQRLCRYFNEEVGVVEEEVIVEKPYGHDVSVGDCCAKCDISEISKVGFRMS